MNDRTTHRIQPLRVALGLMATLAGLDKFFNVLADWGSYVGPLGDLLPFSTATLMRIVGVVEIGVGIALLSWLPVAAAYVAAGWLLLVALNLVTAGYVDVAVRDVVLAIASFTVARLGALRSPVAADTRDANPTVLEAAAATSGASR
jgi:hypothetical protein